MWEGGREGKRELSNTAVQIEKLLLLYSSSCPFKMSNRNKTKSTRTCGKGRRQYKAPAPVFSPSPPCFTACSINYSSENFHILRSIQNKSGRRYRLRLRFLPPPFIRALPCPVVSFRSTAVDLTSNDCPQNGRMPIPAGRNGSSEGGKQYPPSPSSSSSCLLWQIYGCKLFCTRQGQTEGGAEKVSTRRMSNIF